MPTPPPSPLISLSPPSAGERIARIASTQALIDAVTAALPSPPLLPLPPSIYIPPPVDRKDDIPEFEWPPRKRSCLFALDFSTLDAEERRRGIREVGYGIRDTWVDPAETVPEIAHMTVGEALVDAVTAALPSPPLPPLAPSLYIPPFVDRRDDIPESKRPPRKRLCLSTLGSGYEVGESSTARPIGGQGIDYGDTWVDLGEVVPKIAPMTLGEVNTRVTKLAELHEHDTQDIYALLEDAREGRTRIS
ncbi:hypothetical protein Tco_0231386 [Tanacetum coccineum]